MTFSDLFNIANIEYVAVAMAAYFFLMMLYDRVALDGVLNLAQAAMDESRCSLLFDQISQNTVDSDMAAYKEFDLPFIDLALQPTYWWDAIWEYDFWARTVVMQHFAAHSEVLWEEEFADASAYPA